MKSSILFVAFVVTLGVAAFGQDPVVLCQQQVRARQFETAIVTCAEAAKTNAKIGNYGVAAAYVGLSDWNNAVKAFTTLVDAEPMFLDAIVGRGMANYNAGNFKAAYEDLSRAVRMEARLAGRLKPQIDASREIAELLPVKKVVPDIERRSLEASLAANNLLISRSVKKLNKEPQANIDALDRQIVDKIDEAIRINKYNSHAYTVRANFYEAQEQNAKALIEYTKAVAMDPLSASTISTRGKLYMKLNNYGFAAADFTKAIELDAKQSMHYTARAEAYEMSGYIEKALGDLNKVIELAPKNSFGYGMRASFYLRQKDSEKALADLNKAISLNPKDASSLLSRCQFYNDTKKFAPAVTDCTAAINLKDFILSDLALVDRAAAYTGLKKYDLALADLVAAEATKMVSEAETNAQRGVIYLAQGKKADATAAFNAALKVDPKNQKAIDGLKAIK